MVSSLPILFHETCRLDDTILCHQPIGRAGSLANSPFLWHERFRLHDDAILFDKPISRADFSSAQCYFVRYADRPIFADVRSL